MLLCGITFKLEQFLPKFPKQKLFLKLQFHFKGRSFEVSAKINWEIEETFGCSTWEGYKTMRNGNNFLFGHVFSLSLSSRLSLHFSQNWCGISLSFFESLSTRLSLRFSLNCRTYCLKIDCLALWQQISCLGLTLFSIACLVASRTFVKLINCCNKWQPCHKYWCSVQAYYELLHTSLTFMAYNCRTQRQKGCLKCQTAWLPPLPFSTHHTSLRHSLCSCRGQLKLENYAWGQAGIWE